jgi:hypothetical protein
MIINSRYTPAWGSHLPILSRVLSVSTGMMMECGIGFHSTPIMHFFSIEHQQPVYSYESDKTWYETHKYWRNNLHKIELVTDWDTIPIEKHHWGIILIDHEANRRSIEAIRAAQYADYVILHDSNERYNRLYHYERVYPYYKYRYIYDKVPNHTTILSNFIPVDKLWKI